MQVDPWFEPDKVIFGEIEDANDNYIHPCPGRRTDNLLPGRPPDRQRSARRAIGLPPRTDP